MKIEIPGKITTDNQDACALFRSMRTEKARADTLSPGDIVEWENAVFEVATVTARKVAEHEKWYPDLKNEDIVFQILDADDVGPSSCPASYEFERVCRYGLRREFAVEASQPCSLPDHECG